MHALVLLAFALGHQAPKALLLRARLLHVPGVAGGVGAAFVKAQLHGFEVARVVLKGAPGRGGDEVGRQQALQLLGGVFGRFGGGFGGVFHFAGGLGVFGQDVGGQARDFVGDEGQARAAFFHAGGKGGFAGGQRLHQEGAVQRQVDDLLAQLPFGAQRHVEHGHFLQLGNVFFEVFERVADLQGEKPPQSGAVARGGHLRLVKDFDGDGVARVHQRGKADERLALAGNFHQLGQLAKAPAGVALAGGVAASFGFERGPRWLGGRLRRLGCFCRVGGGRVGVEFRLGGFQAGQRLKSAARLAAQFGLEGGEVAARAQLAAVFVYHAHIHEQVCGQHVELEVGAFDVQPGFAAHDLQQRVGQAAVAEGVGRAQFFSQPRGAFGQGHEAAAGLLRQAFEQGLDFFFQHAGHEPLAARFADLVEHEQRRGDGEAVARVARLVQVGGGAVHAAQPQHFGKGGGGDARRFVAHEFFAGER